MKNLIIKLAKTNKLNKHFTESRQIKKTSLYSFHKDLMKAKMVPFAGYDMPVQYYGIIEEHLHCRDNSCIFDVSHMGQIKIYGKDRYEFIESLTVGDIKELKAGSATLSLFTNDRGGIEDDTIITNLQDHLNVVVNAGCKDKDLENMLKHKEEKWSGKDVTIEYLQEKSLIALQGPKSAFVLQKLVGANLSNLNFMEASSIPIPSIDETCLVSRCGYTGEDGFEISVSDKNAVALCENLLKHSEVKMAGLGARDTLRLEAGLCLYGHDMNDSVTPIEASLKWVIGKRRKNHGGFPGYDIINKQIESETTVKRVGFVMESGAPAREDARITTENKDIIIGKVTSGTFSPSLKKPIGMAYINSKFTKIGTQLKVHVRNKEYDIKISKMPFVPQRYYKKKNE